MNVRRYALYGALFGLSFPVMGTVIQALLLPGPLGLGARLARAQASPLLWIIDTAPLFLGVLASFAGLKQDELIASEQARRAAFVETAAQLFAASRDLSATVSSFGALTTETAASVRETTATMGHLGHTAAQAALTAETVVGLALASERCSVDGRQAVETSTAQLGRLADEVRRLSTRIQTLNDRMRDVFEIASVMSYGADRAERLAASAIAEMERSPAARGFAAVVEEMRRQADEARQSTLRVKQILTEIHKVMLIAMTEAQHGVLRAEEGAAVATTTGETIRKLAAALEESSLAAKEIARVAQQQDRGIDQVNQAMNEIFLASEETMEAAQRVAGDAKALNDLAHRLDRAVQDVPAEPAAAARNGVPARP